MSALTYTLVTDGSSDASLKAALEWLLSENGVRCAIQGEWADLRRMPRPPKTLEAKIRAAVELYPCEVMFVHRDAENASRQMRKREIETALQAASFEHGQAPAWIAVIPVKMQEAWLLFDEMAIRQAAGNPSGRIPLRLPALDKCEDLPDPKLRLYEIFREASELGTGRRAKLGVARMTRRVADFIGDFSPLRALSAFTALEQELREAIQRHGWNRR